MGLGTIALFAWAVRTRDLVHAQTIAFLTLMLFQMFHVLAIRSSAILSGGSASSPIHICWEPPF